jgi:hypothetical protein
MTVDTERDLPALITELTEAMNQASGAIVQAVDAIKPTPKLSDVELKKALENGVLIPYRILVNEAGIDMTTAKTNFPYLVRGKSLLVATDGTLDGVTIRFNMKTADAIPVKYMRLWIGDFFQIFLTHAAQSGKKLWIITFNETVEVKALAAVSAVSAEILNKVSSDLFSTVANINNGITFTGDSFSVEEYAAIVISLYADQDLTLYVDQSLDGTNYDISESQGYASSDAKGFEFKVIGRTARIRINNDSGANTTVLRAHVAARRM